jgi:hypothetical protein
MMPTEDTRALASVLESGASFAGAGGDFRRESWYFWENHQGEKAGASHACKHELSQEVVGLAGGIDLAVGRSHGGGAKSASR